MSTRECEVLVAGGGPAGLLLAALLAGHGVDVAVLERRRAPGRLSRAIGLHPPALGALAAVGLAGAAVAEGVRVERGVARSRGRTLGEVTFERAWPETPFVLTLPQHRTEALLAARLADLAPGALRRGCEVVDAHDDGDRVHVTTAEHRPGGPPARTRWRARVLIGADGARSRVRESSGLAATAHPYPDAYLMGDVADTTGDGTAAAVHLEPGGVVESFPLPGGVRRWVVRTGRRPAEPAVELLAALVAERTGTVLDTTTSTMVSAFGVRRRLAPRTVRGRRVLVGDAAHEISPIGGQGMTLGWLDAQALAPVLVDLLRGRAGGDRSGDLRAVPRLRDFEETRTRAARSAARRAGANTALGRPWGAWGSAGRDALVRGALRSPAGDRLAGALTMRWA
ncbi:FAD-dependent oxidoreductase [Kineococcus sp. G2]|uniref:FAD-dependent oxidoreductase n=1 Tax=Kineococcus sp. G2 TaxID=3127484 RepID=UPI00301E3147